MRPTLVGRRGCNIRADSTENLGCSSLDVFEALAEKLRIAPIETDIVLRSGASFEFDCPAYNECNRLSFGFADPRQGPRAGHSLCSGLDAAPPASQAFAPGVVSETEACFNHLTVNERTRPKAIPLNI